MSRAEVQVTLVSMVLFLLIRPSFHGAEGKRERRFVPGRRQKFDKLASLGDGVPWDRWCCVVGGAALTSVPPSLSHSPLAAFPQSPAFSSPRTWAAFPGSPPVSHSFHLFTLLLVCSSTAQPTNVSIAFCSCPFIFSNKVGSTCDFPLGTCCSHSPLRSGFSSGSSRSSEHL